MATPLVVEINFLIMADHVEVMLGLPDGSQSRLAQVPAAIMLPEYEEDLERFKEFVNKLAEKIVMKGIAAAGKTGEMLGVFDDKAGLKEAMKQRERHLAEKN